MTSMNSWGNKCDCGERTWMLPFIYTLGVLSVKFHHLVSVSVIGTGIMTSYNINYICVLFHNTINIHKN